MPEFSDTLTPSLENYGTNAQISYEVRRNIASIDAKVDANTTLYTVESGMQFQPISAYVTATDISGLITAPIIRIGSSSGSYSNFIPAVSCSSLTTTGRIIPLGPFTTTMQKIFTSGEVIELDVVTVANATTFTIGVIIIGRLF